MNSVIPPIVSSHPADKIVPEGDTVTFAVNATGSEPLSFQWHHGQNAISGATGRTLTLADVAVPDAGSYSVVISNSGGTALSNFAELKVSPMTGTGGLFSATEKFGDDWEFVSWFGFFNTRVFPWIYHEHLRWLFVAEDSTDDAMWLFEITLGWLFTSKTLYPEMFNASLDTWLSFSMVEGDSRIFVDLETHELLVVE